MHCVGAIMPWSSPLLLCTRHIVLLLRLSLAHGHGGAVNVALSSLLLSHLVAWAGTINVLWLLLLCTSHLPHWGGCSGRDASHKV